MLVKHINQGLFGVANVAPSLSNPSPVALAYRTTSQSVTDGTACTLTAERYDNNSAFSPSDTKIVTPSAGLYRMTMSDYTTASGVGSSLQVGGANAAGGFINLGATSPCWSTGSSAIMSIGSAVNCSMLAAGGTTTHNTSGSYQSFGMEKLDPNTWYALVQISGNATMSSSVSPTVSWDVNTVNVCGTGSWHSTSVNPSRLTVPTGAGINRVRLSFNIVQGSVASVWRVGKNGTFTGIPGMPAKKRGTTGPAYMGHTGPPVNVADGDYFELTLLSGNSRTVNASFGTWFSVEQVPAGVKSCIATASSGTIGTSDAVVPFPNEEYDDASMHSTVSDTDRLTVPAGCTYAKVYWFIRTTANARLQVQVGCSAGNVGGGQDNEGVNAADLGYSSGVSSWIPVTAGDYFWLAASASQNATIAEAWFAMECI